MLNDPMRRMNAVIFFHTKSLRDFQKQTLKHKIIQMMQLVTSPMNTLLVVSQDHGKSIVVQLAIRSQELLKNKMANGFVVVIWI